MSAPEFQRALYLARRRAEQALQDVPDLHVIGLSASSIGYKGMVLPESLPKFYLDLQRPDLASSCLLYTSRCV